MADSWWWWYSYHHSQFIHFAFCFNLFSFLLFSFKKSFVVQIKRLFQWWWWWWRKNSKKILILENKIKKWNALVCFSDYIILLWWLWSMLANEWMADLLVNLICFINAIIISHHIHIHIIIISKYEWIFTKLNKKKFGWLSIFFGNYHPETKRNEKKFGIHESNQTNSNRKDHQTKPNKNWNGLMRKIEKWWWWYWI